MEKLIIFDLTGTLAEPESGNTFRAPGEAYVWLPGMKELLIEKHDKGIHLAVAYNSGGISAGYVTYRDEEQAIHSLLSTLPFHVPWLMCPYVGTYRDSEKWKAFASWRKPSPVMYLMLAAQFPHVPQEAVLCVGDRDEDKFAAWNAGYQFEFVTAYKFTRQARQRTAPALDEEAEDIPF